MVADSPLSAGEFHFAGALARFLQEWNLPVRLRRLRRPHNHPHSSRKQLITLLQVQPYGASCIWQALIRMTLLLLWRWKSTDQQPMGS